MNKNDRFLIGIIAGAFILLIAAFLFAMLRPDPGYLPDDSAENVVHNYLLAIENRDFARAYSYLSPELADYPPDLETFIYEIELNSWIFGRNTDHSLTIQSSETVGTMTIVTVRVAEYYNDLPFGGQPNLSTFTMRLEPGGPGWVLIYGERFFIDCWYRLESFCHQK